MLINILYENLGKHCLLLTSHYYYLSIWWHREVCGRETVIREGVLVEQDTALSVKESLPGCMLGGTLLEVYVWLRLLAVCHHPWERGSCVYSDLRAQRVHGVISNCLTPQTKRWLYLL